jgi:exportin-1
METYIKKAEDLEIVNSSFIPPLLDAILGDYNRNVPTARDAEVLNVMATITSRLGVSAFVHCILFAEWSFFSRS